MAQAGQVVVDEDQRHAHCKLQWVRRTYVYRQLLVWLWRALRLDDNKYVYLLALLAATNGLIVLFSTLELSVLLVIGSIVLGVGCTHLFCVLSLTYRRLQPVQNWTEREESDFLEVCGHMATLNLYLVDYMQVCIAMRNQDAKKFYIVGLLASILVSALGSQISGATLLHVSGNLLLLLPLCIKHSVVSHMQETGGQLLHSINATRAIGNRKY